MLTGYLAPEGLEKQHESELRNIKDRIGRLFIAEGPVQKVYFAQNIWVDVQRLSFASISDAAKQLKALNKLWAFYPHHFVRRGQLITEKLSYFSPKPLAFPSKAPASGLGSWVMVDENTLYAAARCSSPLAHGQAHFQETKIPPSRAYLKLWEVFTLIGVMPKPGDKCLEIGASPGSWTWVLQQLGADVIAIDRASLAESIASLDRITFLKKDAFTLKPEELAPVDWIFSDVICYPEKLLEWIHKWLAVCPEANFICTIKFQGDGGYEIVKEFEKIQGSFVIHLSNNKHELTWVRVKGISTSITGFQNL